VIKPGEAALSRARLAHVDQYYVRAENHAAANAVLIDAQAEIPIAQAWGGGLLASVDGLRFVVPVRTINAGPSPKYFGYKRGITWLNAVNDQVAGIGQVVVPGIPRDALFILDALLNLDAGPKPEVFTTDNASYSDMVFGVFAILNYQFAPRFADLPDQRYWRAPLPKPLPAGVELSAEQAAIGDYGPLEVIARHTVNVAKIETQCPDMLRVAGSLVTNQVRAYDLLRMFGRDGHPTPARAGVHRVRPDRQDAAPARARRPDKWHLPAADEPATDRAGVPPPPRPQDLSWQPRPDPAGLPRKAKKTSSPRSALVLNAVVL
jgi:TnpA family transposase